MLHPKLVLSCPPSALISLAPFQKTHLFPWQLLNQRYSICSLLRRKTDWIAQHPGKTTRNTALLGGKKSSIRDSLFGRVGSNRAVWGNMGKSIKSECVIQILSRAQKHEQVLKFPTHILSAWSCFVSAHKWPHAACGLRGGNYLFIGSWTGLVTDWAGLSVCQDGLGRDQDCLDALDALFGLAQSAHPQPPPMMVSHLSGRDPPFRLPLLAVQHLLVIIS